jgi:hypothetical protein
MKTYVHEYQASRQAARQEAGGMLHLLWLLCMQRCNNGLRSDDLDLMI